MKQIDRFVRSAIGRRKSEPPARVEPPEPEQSPEEALLIEAPKPLRLFERRGPRFVLYPEAFGAAEVEARAELLGHLRGFIKGLEGASS